MVKGGLGMCTKHTLKEHSARASVVKRRPGGVCKPQDMRKHSTRTYVVKRSPVDVYKPQYLKKQYASAYVVNRRSRGCVQTIVLEGALC